MEHDIFGRKNFPDPPALPTIDLTEEQRLQLKSFFENFLNSSNVDASGVPVDSPRWIAGEKRALLIVVDGGEVQVSISNSIRHSANRPTDEFFQALADLMGRHRPAPAPVQ